MVVASPGIGERGKGCQYRLNHKNCQFLIIFNLQKKAISYGSTSYTFSVWGSQTQGTKNQAVRGAARYHRFSWPLCRRGPAAALEIPQPKDNWSQTAHLFAT